MDTAQKSHTRQIAKLIDTQRRLANSGNSSERLVGTLIIAGRLSRCLTRVSDRVIGSLMFKHIWNVLMLTSPEMTIAMEATRRLLRKRRKHGRT
jgi:hypothetical protein